MYDQISSRPIKVPGATVTAFMGAWDLGDFCKGEPVMLVSPDVYVLIDPDYTNEPEVTIERIFAGYDGQTGFAFDMLDAEYREDGETIAAWRDIEDEMSDEVQRAVFDALQSLGLEAKESGDCIIADFLDKCPEYRC